MRSVEGTPVSAVGTSGRTIWWLTVLGAAVALGMLALGAAVLVDARQDAWHQAEQAANNLSTALERDIERTLSIYDLSLRGAMDAMTEPEIRDAAPKLRQRALFDSSAAAEYLGSMLVLGPTGDIVYDSISAVPHTLNLADRDYFQVHKDRADAGLFVSRAFFSRLRGGDASLAISRRLSKPDGSFDGIVLGTLRLAYFKDLFAQLDLGERGAVTLTRTDGHVLIRQTNSGTELNLERPGNSVIDAFGRAPVGAFVADSRYDGVRRLFTYRQIGSLPLIVVVAQAVTDIYAPWWQKATGIGAILVILCGATVVLCLLFRREMLRRLVAETALMDTAGKLSIMAATDELTGLANRRAFEAGLVQEWRRAGRTGQPVALIMLDADYFKAYNDQYGHQAGDEVLRRLAACLADNVRRPGDLGARYGGEEFVALLPDTQLPGALAAAHRICSGVAAMALAHAGSPFGHVTVSVGVAVGYAGTEETEVRLLRRADQALYEAKRLGRARVCLAGIPDAAAPMPDTTNVAAMPPADVGGRLAAN